MTDLFPDSAPAGGATFSPCGVYRYHLWRARPMGSGTCLWVMLNPSTADAQKDDVWGDQVEAMV